MLYNVSLFCTTCTSGRQSFSRVGFFCACSTATTPFLAAAPRSTIGARCPLEEQPTSTAAISNSAQILPWFILETSVGRGGVCGYGGAATTRCGEADGCGSGRMAPSPPNGSACPSGG